MSGSDKSTSTTNSQTTPWGPQAGALTSAFASAQDAFGKSSQAVAPNDFVSQFTPQQLATFQSMLGYANNSNIPGQNAATGSALSSAGTGATTGALSGLANFDPSSSNNPETLVSAAQKYVDGLDINAQVNNSMLNARQTARDVTLPGIEQNAARTGNTNSSRTGIADGLVERGLAEQANDLGSTLRNNAFSTGLALASNNANTASAQRLGALSTGAAAGIDAAKTGVGANSQSVLDQTGLFGLSNAGGSGLQASQQAILDNMLKQYQSRVSAPYDSVNGLMGVIGTNNWGANTTGTTETTKTPSTWSVLGGLLSGAGSAAQSAASMGYKPFA
jgi:hypothetical protein